MPQTYPKFCGFLSAFCSAIIMIRDLKVHPSLAVIKVLALGSVVETLLCYTASSNQNGPRPGSRPSLEGRWHRALTGEQEARIHKTGRMKSPTPCGSLRERQALPASLATQAKSSELIPHTPVLVTAVCLHE